MRPKLSIRVLMIVVLVAALAIQGTGLSAKRARHLKRVAFHETLVRDMERSLKVETNKGMRAWATGLAEYHRKEAKAHQWLADHPWQGEHVSPPIPMPRPNP